MSSTSSETLTTHDNDDVIEQMHRIGREGVRKGVRHSLRRVLHIGGFAAQSTGAVLLAGPSIIHEAGAQVDIPRTIVGGALGILAYQSLREASKEAELTEEAFESTTKRVGEIAEEHETFLLNQPEELDVPEG